MFSHSVINWGSLSSAVGGSLCFIKSIPKQNHRLFASMQHCIDAVILAKPSTVCTKEHMDMLFSGFSSPVSFSHQKSLKIMLIYITLSAVCTVWVLIFLSELLKYVTFYLLLYCIEVYLYSSTVVAVFSFLLLMLVEMCCCMSLAFMTKDTSLS